MKHKWLKVPEGESITIRVLIEQPTHEFTYTKEELERYRQATRDCPCCAAGIPFSNGQKP
jgi:hypothetical protein